MSKASSFLARVRGWRRPAPEPWPLPVAQTRPLSNLHGEELSALEAAGYVPLEALVPDLAAPSTLLGHRVAGMVSVHGRPGPLRLTVSSVVRPRLDTADLAAAGISEVLVVSARGGGRPSDLLEVAVCTDVSWRVWNPSPYGVSAWVAPADLSPAEGEVYVRLRADGLDPERAELFARTV